MHFFNPVPVMALVEVVRTGLSSDEAVETAEREVTVTRFEQAWREGDWQHGRFHLPPDDQDEFIPLPER